MFVYLNFGNAKSSIHIESANNLIGWLIQFPIFCIYFYHFYLFFMLMLTLKRIAVTLFNCLSKLLIPIRFLLPQQTQHLMKEKAPPINEEVAYANYRTFCSLCTRVRESLNKAITADELYQKNTTKMDKRAVIQRYQKVISELESGLSLKASSCPRNKQTEVELQQKKLLAFLQTAKDRLSDHAGANGEVRVQPGCSSRVRQIPIAIHGGSQPQTNFSRPIEKAKFLQGVNAKFGEEIISTIVPTTGISLEDVKGNEAAKRALEECVVLPSLNPKLFTGLRAPSKGILLFGPPGNGKTMLAKAAASECHCTFFNISAATIMSKWVGDGERLVQALFQVAINAQPSIIFIDEVDSMLCERSEQENGAARRVKTEFLVQLDGCSSRSEDRVLVLAATNRPQELDEGILRRFSQRIFIDLPEKSARAEMIRRTFKQHKTNIRLSDKELDRIAARTENYSYSDLMELCRAAALNPIQELGKDQLRHCSEKELRAVNADDLEVALRTVRPSTNPENRRKIVEFARNHAKMA